MQPYLFPYIGYFQLIMSSDVFVIYDDVNYIRRGYINRNNILANGVSHRFTVPAINGSQNNIIKDVQFDSKLSKIFMTIQHAYSRASFAKTVLPIIEDILEYKERDIPSLCKYSYENIFEYLGVTKKIIFSSDLKYERTQAADQKLVSICKELGGTEYINSPGGRELYNSEMFQPHGIELKFIEPSIEEYPQYGTEEFVPYLSIIDILMNCSPQEIVTMFAMYELNSGSE